MGPALKRTIKYSFIIGIFFNIVRVGCYLYEIMLEPLTLQWC